MDEGLSNDDYHALGHHYDPAKAVLSATQLLAGFNPHPAVQAHPWATLQSIVGEPRLPTKYMLCGTFLHALVLEGKRPLELTPAPFSWEAKSGLLEIQMGTLWQLAGVLVPPEEIKPANHNEGKAQREQLELLSVNGAGEEFPPSHLLAHLPLSEIHGAFREATALATFLEYDLFETTSKAHARHLLMDAKGVVEQSFSRYHNEFELRARPDKILSEDDALINIKRTYKAPPAAFWREADLRGWWIQEAFYEYVLMACDACRGTGREGEGACAECSGLGNVPGGGERPWVIVAIAPATKRAPPQAYCYPCPRDRQEKARDQLFEMLSRYEICVETTRWETFAESLREQPAPGSLYDYRADYEAAQDALEDEGGDEAPWDETEIP